MDPAAVRQLVIAVVPSVLVSTVVMWALWWRPGRAGATGATAAGEKRPWWAAGLVWAGLVAVIYAIAEGRWYLPPISRKDWVPVIAVGGLVLGVGLGLARRGVNAGRRGLGRAAAGWGVKAAALGLVGLACAWPKVMNAWSAAETAAWLGAFVALATAAWAASERVTERAAGAQGPLAVMLLAGGASQVLVLGYASFDQAQLVAIIAAAAGPMWVLGMLRPGFSLGRGGATVPVLVVAAATFQSVLYGSAEGTARWVMAPLVALSAAAGLIADAPVIARRGGVVRGMVRVAAVGACAGAAVAVGVLLKPEPVY